MNSEPQFELRIFGRSQEDGMFCLGLRHPRGTVRILARGDTVHAAFADLATQLLNEKATLVCLSEEAV